MSLAGLTGRSDGSRVRACVAGPLGTAVFVGFCLWGLYAQLSGMINHDTAWYLQSVAAFFDGGRLYRDVFFDVNPPLAFYLAVPPAYLARLTGLFPVDVFVVYVFGLIALSLILVWQLLPARSDRPLGRGLLFAAMLALVVAPAHVFGQREHLMLVLALPYLLLLAGRASGAEFGRSMAVAVGVLAALGFGLKPHFLLVLAGLELYLLLRRKRLGGLFRSETLAMAAVLLLYGGAVLAVTPDYVTRVVPYALAVYNDAYRNSLTHLLWRQETLFVVLLPLLHLVARPRTASKAFGDVFVIAAVCFYVVYFIQMKGWLYHLYPASACLLLAAGAMLFGTPLSAPAEVPVTLGKRPAFNTILTAAIALMMLVGAALWRGGYRNAYTEAFAPIVREHAAGSSILVLTTEVSRAFPLVNYAGVEWSSRFSALWLLPGLERARRAPAAPMTGERRALLDEIEGFLIDAVVADLGKRPPAVVIVDMREEKSYFGGLRFDYLAYFSKDPRFAEIWSRYELLVNFGTYDVYKRRPGPH